MSAKGGGDPFLREKQTKFLECSETQEYAEKCLETFVRVSAKTFSLKPFFCSNVILKKEKRSRFFGLLYIRTEEGGQS